jgi:transporter family-2 protein
MAWLLVVIALGIGVFLPLQAGINAELRIWIGHPLSAALVSFGVGTAALLLLNLSLGVPLDVGRAVGGAPWWVWLGGLLGATYVSMTVVLAPRLGAAVMLGAVMTGQLAGSLLMDHFGVVGYSPRPISLERIGGAVLLLLGVLLIQKG